MPSLASHLIPRTIRGQVSVVLNGTLLVLFGLFLAYDYHNDTADRIELKRAALEEQARILLPAVQSKPTPAELHSYLAETRRQMEATHTDAHVVAVDVQGRFFQSGLAAAQAVDVAAQLRTNARTGTAFLQMDDDVYLVGQHRAGGTAVYVAEDMHDIRAGIHADLKRHLVVVGIALCCTIAILNSVLWVVFQRPLAILTRAVAAIGAGQVGLQIERIGTVELDILASAINDMSRALAEVDSARAAQMRKAQAIQLSLLPTQLLLEGAALAHHFQPTETVGGDYYDLFRLRDGGTLLAIADVTGHGVAAALVAAMVKICLLDAVEHLSDPGQILALANRRLSAMQLPDMFVSMLLVRHDRAPGALAYAGAGHPPALVVDRGGSVRELPSQGSVLGIDATADWTTEQARIAPGDRLLLYTDGVTEAPCRDAKLYGLARLRQSFVDSRHETPAQAVQTMMRRLAEQCVGQAYPDDITLVLADV